MSASFFDSITSIRLVHGDSFMVHDSCRLGCRIDAPTIPTVVLRGHHGAVASNEP